MQLFSLRCLQVLAASTIAVASIDCSAQRIANIYGAGGVACGDYLEHRKRSSPGLDSTYVSWINGYISGYNQFSPNNQVVNSISPPTLLAYVDKHCRDNPLDPLKYAADRLLIELGAKLFTLGQVK